MTPFTLHYGDCLEQLAAFPAGAADLVLTDPPYACRYRDNYGRTVINDDRTDWIAPAFKLIARAMRPHSVCVSFYGWNAADRFHQAWQAAGLRPIGHIVWPKPYTSRSGFLEARHEQAYVLAKGNPRKPHRRLQDVQKWTYTGNQLHPTQKAVEILEPLIETFSDPGQLVLDPFMGSGSTGLAALKTGRRFTGIEIDAVHYNTARNRMQGFERPIREKSAYRGRGHFSPFLHPAFLC